MTDDHDDQPDQSDDYDHIIIIDFNHRHHGCCPCIDGDDISHEYNIRNFDTRKGFSFLNNFPMNIFIISYDYPMIIKPVGAAMCS